MPQAEIEIGAVDRQKEDARQAALIAAGILDTPPEPAYDTITRLAAEYFHADSALPMRAASGSSPAGAR